MTVDNGQLTIRTIGRKVFVGANAPCALTFCVRPPSLDWTFCVIQQRADTRSAPTIRTSQSPANFPCNKPLKPQIIVSTIKRSSCFAHFAPKQHVITMKTISATFRSPDAADITARKITRLLNDATYKIIPTDRSKSWQDASADGGLGAMGFSNQFADQFADRQNQIGILNGGLLGLTYSGFNEYCPDVELVLNVSPPSLDSAISILINNRGENISVHDRS